MDVEEQLRLMREDWDQRARTNALHYIVTAEAQWDPDEFYRSGEETLRNYILQDLGNICQGKPPGQMRVLEIGCGAGRLTCALARFFGEVHAVDISEEMISRARTATAQYTNVHLYRNSGKDLDVLPEMPFDFAFSHIVFQHIPSREVIQSYAVATAQRLRPGALFKLQLQGADIQERDADTWVGVGFSESDAQLLANASGFELRYSQGAGTQDYWLWFFAGKPAI